MNLQWLKADQWLFADGIGGGRVKGAGYKWARGSFWRQVCVHCLDCSDDLTGVYVSKHQILLFKYVQFIIYISKGI